MARCQRRPLSLAQVRAIEGDRRNWPPPQSLSGFLSQASEKPILHHAKGSLFRPLPQDTMQPERVTDFSCGTLSVSSRRELQPRQPLWRALKRPSHISTAQATLARRASAAVRRRALSDREVCTASGSMTPAGITRNHIFQRGLTVRIPCAPSGESDELDSLANSGRRAAASQRADCIGRRRGRTRNEGNQRCGWQAVNLSTASRGSPQLTAFESLNSRVKNSARFSNGSRTRPCLMHAPLPGRPLLWLRCSFRGFVWRRRRVQCTPQRLIAPAGGFLIAVRIS
jgi:hypothetical protein